LTHLTDRPNAAPPNPLVTDWKTAQLSATQTAELLESYNQMSMKLAAQTAVMSQRQEANERVIAELNQELRKLKGKSPLRSMRKAFSSTVRGIKHSMSSPNPRVVTTVSPLSDSIPKQTIPKQI
jgi:hypothetical protein